MDDVNQINNELTQKEPKQKLNKLLLILLILAILSTIGLAIALWWCLTRETPRTESGSESGGTSAAAGPCYDGENNELPAGYAWYENAELGFKFAHPSSWGALTVAVTPMGGVDGHYMYGTFAGNENVIFGGNGTDYVVNPRGGMPTDNPGYLEATGKFYSVQIWKLNNPGAEIEPKYALWPIEEETLAKNGCNTKAVITQHDETEFLGYGYDLARFNLQPNNLYYGVNFIFKNPDAALRADMDKVVRSFQLIP